MKHIRPVSPSLGCIVAFALITVVGCNNKATSSAGPGTHAQAPLKMKMTTDIPAEITTPDTVETRIGTLKLFDGFPDDATTQKVYDNLDVQRGVEAFLNAMPGAAVTAFRPALRELGEIGRAHV